MQKPKNYQLVVETLSPLHIGTGQTLQKDFDYVVYRGRTYVVDVDRLSDEIFEAGGANLDRLLQGQPAAQLLSDEDYRRDDYFRYVLEGEPRATSKGAEIQTCIKNAWDYPYIPGSSLKGAVRTAILYNIFEREELKIHVDDLGRKPKFAAQRLEEMAFGKDPNHDWLRCLHFSDSEPIEREYLQLLNVNVFAKGKPQSPVELEGVGRGVRFSMTMTLDIALMQSHEQLDWNKERLKYISKFQNLSLVVNTFARIRILQQHEYWKERSKRIAGFYVELLKQVEKLIETRDGFLLQVGWGGGWDSKTLGDLLTKDKKLFEQIMRQYGKQMNKQNAWKAGRPYPTSRRMVVYGEQPHFPLGWLYVGLEQ